MHDAFLRHCLTTIALAGLARGITVTSSQIMSGAALQSSSFAHSAEQ